MNHPLYYNILNRKNDPFCHMMSCMFCLFSLQVLEKSDSEVLDFWTFSELAILDWFSLESLSSYTVSA